MCGGGGGFFGGVVNTITNAVKNLGHSFESGGQAVSALAKGDFGGATAKFVNSTVNSLGFNDVLKPYSPQARTAQQPQAEAEGGTPTANAAGAQTSKAAGSAAALSGSQQAVNETSGSGTMLTGNSGVDQQSLELGRKTLLGG